MTSREMHKMGVRVRVTVGTSDEERGDSDRNAHDCDGTRQETRHGAVLHFVSTVGNVSLPEWLTGSPAIQQLSGCALHASVRIAQLTTFCTIPVSVAG